MLKGYLKDSLENTMRFSEMPEGYRGEYKEIFKEHLKVTWESTKRCLTDTHRISWRIQGHSHEIPFRIPKTMQGEI